MSPSLWDRTVIVGLRGRKIFLCWIPRSGNISLMRCYQRGVWKSGREKLSLGLWSVLFPGYFLSVIKDTLLLLKIVRKIPFFPGKGSPQLYVRVSYLGMVSLHFLQELISFSWSSALSWTWKVAVPGYQESLISCHSRGKGPFPRPLKLIRKQRNSNIAHGL